MSNDDPTAPTEWEKANKNVAKDAFGSIDKDKPQQKVPEAENPKAEKKFDMPGPGADMVRRQVRAEYNIRRSKIIDGLKTDDSQKKQAALKDDADKKAAAQKNDAEKKAAGLTAEAKRKEAMAKTENTKSQDPNRPNQKSSEDSAQRATAEAARAASAERAARMAAQQFNSAARGRESGNTR